MYNPVNTGLLYTTQNKFCISNNFCILVYARSTILQIFTLFVFSTLIVAKLIGVVFLLVFFDTIYLGIFRLISVFQTTAMLKFANSLHYPPAPFARFLGSLMRL